MTDELTLDEWRLIESMVKSNRFHAEAHAELYEKVSQIVSEKEKNDDVSVVE